MLLVENPSEVNMFDDYNPYSDLPFDFLVTLDFWSTRYSYMATALWLLDADI